MSTEQELAAIRNEDLAKELFRPWIYALRTQPIEDVLANPSLRKRYRRLKEDPCTKTT